MSLQGLDEAQLVLGIETLVHRDAGHRPIEHLVRHLLKLGARDGAAVSDDAELGGDNCCSLGVVARSEEHTSELQSLMRISYAVFCLKKKNTTNTQDTDKDINKNHRTTTNDRNEHTNSTSTRT